MSIGVDSNENRFAVISVVDVESATVTQLTADTEGSILLRGRLTEQKLPSGQGATMPAQTMAICM